MNENKQMFLAYFRPYPVITNKEDERITLTLQSCTLVLFGCSKKWAG